MGDLLLPAQPSHDISFLQEIKISIPKRKIQVANFTIDFIVCFLTM